MSNYDAAFEQFHEETGCSMKQFEKNVEDYGWGYVTYYYKRWVDARTVTNYSIDPEGY